MSITIMGHPGGTIRVSGDIETVLIAPCVKRGQPFVMSFSDGTLIEGIHAPATGGYHVRTLVEGAGLLVVEGDRMRLLWMIEWATIAAASGMTMAGRGEDSRPDRMPVETGPDVGSMAEWRRLDAAHEHEQMLAQVA